MNTTAESTIKRLWSLVLYAFQIPVEDSHSKRRTAIIFSLLLAAHLVVLPAHVLGSDIGLLSFSHLNLRIVLFAFLFATLESVLINLWVQLKRQKNRCRTAPAAGGIVIGMVSPLLCCTPLLPTILSFAAILFPSTVLGMGLKIQYAVNVYQTELLLLALVLLLGAIVQNAWHLNSGHAMAGHNKK
jgi:hypothetical protein